MSRQATIYTREGCGLCKEAQSMLERYGFTTEMVDIDSDPELTQKYDTVIPVVLIDGVERFRGRINEALLRRLL